MKRNDKILHYEGLNC
ncbi:hypothetical protein [Escherichia coli]|nr:hypothetical protein [Escherichia coli]